MTEKPILFSAPMVRAILAGTKTQTRRIVKPQPDAEHNGEPYWNIGGYRAWQYRGITDPLRMGTHNPIGCPFGSPKTRLWVRETTRSYFLPHLLTGEPTNALCGQYAADDAPVLDEHGFDCAWWYSRNSCPGIHMPRWASRITLEVTGVRVERLQDISEADCQAEGIESYALNGRQPTDGDGSLHLPAGYYRYLWESINGPGSWQANPWVWVVEFRRVAP